MEHMYKYRSKMNYTTMKSFSGQMKYQLMKLIEMWPIYYAASDQIAGKLQGFISELVIIFSTVCNCRKIRRISCG